VACFPPIQRVAVTYNRSFTYYIFLLPEFAASIIATKTLLTYLHNGKYILPFIVDQMVL